MKIVSTSYTGVIPGIGKGPFTNLKISDTLYANLHKLGYPVTETSVAAKPKVVVTNVSAPSVPKKPVTKAEEAVKEAKVAATKPEAVAETPKVEAVAPVVPEVSETPEVAEAPAEVVTEAVAPEVEEPTTTNVSYTKDELEAMDQSQLEEILGPDVKRPLRYGKPWLIKQILAL